MAKVMYSAMVNTMRGRLNFSVLSAWRGVNIAKRHNPGPRQPRNNAQQTVRMLLADLAGNWYNLTTDQREIWNRYASLVPGPQSGFNSYVGLNASLIRFGMASTPRTAPPPYPDTPPRLVGYTITAAAGSAHLVWTAPSDASYWIVLNASPLAGRDDGAHPRWTYVGATNSGALGLTHTHTYPTGVIMRYRVLVYDLYGRKSPPTESLRITLTGT